LAIQPAGLHNAGRQSGDHSKHDPARDKTPVRETRERKRDAYADPDAERQPDFWNRPCFRLRCVAHAVILATDSIERHGGLSDLFNGKNVTGRLYVPRHLGNRDSGLCVGLENGGHPARTEHPISSRVANRKPRDAARTAACCLHDELHAVMLAAGPDGTRGLLWFGMRT
jgi:hypothetical protein